MSLDYAKKKEEEKKKENYLWFLIYMYMIDIEVENGCIRWIKYW